MTNIEDQKSPVEGTAVEKAEGGGREAKEQAPLERLEAATEQAISGTEGAKDAAVQAGVSRIESGVDAVKGTPADKDALRKEVRPVAAQMEAVVVETKGKVAEARAEKPAGGAEEADRKKEAAKERIRDGLVMIVDDNEGVLDVTQGNLKKLGKTEGVVAVKSVTGAHKALEQAFQGEIPGGTVMMVLDMDILHSEDENIPERGAGAGVFVDAQKQLEAYNLARVEAGKPLVKLEVIFNSSHLSDPEEREDAVADLAKEHPGFNVEGAGFSSSKIGGADALLAHMAEKVVEASPENLKVKGPETPKDYAERIPEVDRQIAGPKELGTILGVLRETFKPSGLLMTHDKIGNLPTPVQEIMRSETASSPEARQEMARLLRTFGNVREAFSGEAGTQLLSDEEMEIYRRTNKTDYFVNGGLPDTVTQAILRIGLTGEKSAAEAYEEIARRLEGGNEEMTAILDDVRKSNKEEWRKQDALRGQSVRELAQEIYPELMGQPEMAFMQDLWAGKLESQFREQTGKSPIKDAKDLARFGLEKMGVKEEDLSDADRAEIETFTNPVGPSILLNRVGQSTLARALKFGA